MKKIGSGAFRVVYEHPDDPSLVIKVPKAGKERYAQAMNAEEIKAYYSFPDFFPKPHNRDLSALIVDRAPPITTNEEILKAIPGLKILVDKNGSLSPAQHMQLLLRLTSGEIDKLEYRERSGVRGKLAQKVAQSSPFLSAMARAVPELGIDVEDIDIGNIGVSQKTGKVVLLDASTMAGFRGEISETL